MGQLRFDPRGHAILLDVEMEGPATQRTYVRMALDTGASLTVIPWNIAELLGFYPARIRRRMRFMTGSGMEAAPVLIVNAIEVLGIRVPRVPVLCHDLPQRSLVDGLLGLSFLKHCRLAVDFHKGLLELERAVPSSAD
jgi:clan AA aspartic protease (TIGR02281 family)